LFIIDGVEKESDFDLGSILQVLLKAINVYKDEGSLDKYGKKGENRVVESTT